MELTKEISYDKNLIQKSNFNLKYSGKLYKSGSEELYIVYGYDKDWKNTTEQKMNKVDDGFVTNISIQEFDSFNFCFKNSLNEWDNNDSSDYHLKISTEETILQETNKELNDLLDQILSEVEASNSIQDSYSNFRDYLDENMEDVFSVDTNSSAITSEDQNLASYLEASFDEIFDNNEYIATSSDTDQDLTSYFEELFDELYLNIKVDELSNNLDLAQTFPSEFEEVTPEVTTTTDELEYKNAEKELQEILNTSSLALTKPTTKKSIFDFENLSPWYLLKKRIRLAIYKILYVLPSFLFGEDDDEN